MTSATASTVRAATDPDTGTGTGTGAAADSGPGGAAGPVLPGAGGGTQQAAAERVWGHLRSLVLEHNERRKEVADALGMSFFRVKALRRIAAQSYRMSELAAELASDRPYLTLVVDDLEQRGLVQRTQHPTDRRCKIVSATPAGQAAAARANAILGTPPPALLALPADDLATLDRITSELATLAHEG